MTRCSLGTLSEPNWVTSWVLELEADVFRLRTVIRLCQPLKRTALLVRQPCARQFFGNCPIRVDSRVCRAHPYTDKSRRCDSHSTLEGRTELGRPFERRSPRSASNTSQGRQLSACWPPARIEHLSRQPRQPACSLRAIGAATRLSGALAAGPRI